MAAEKESKSVDTQMNIEASTTGVAGKVGRDQIINHNHYYGDSCSEGIVNQPEEKNVGKGRLVYSITGDLEDANINRARLELIAEELNERGFASLKIKVVEQGSIKIILEGDEDELNELKELFLLGELGEVGGFPVREVRFLTEEEEKRVKEKLRFVERFLITKGIEQREINLQGTDLREANLQKAYLKGACLQQVYLGGAYLQQAKLQKANLQGADLRGADLRGANLKGANLQGAYLQRAYLRGASLQQANLEQSNLRRANLRGADLKGANLQQAYLRGTDLKRAYLQGANLQQANLQFAQFGHNQGISKEVKADLIQRGAIFHD